MEVVRLAPKAEVTMYPWKEPKDLIAQAVRHVRDFLRAHDEGVACLTRDRAEAPLRPSRSP